MDPEKYKKVVWRGNLNEEMTGKVVVVGINDTIYVLFSVLPCFHRDILKKMLDAEKISYGSFEKLGTKFPLPKSESYEVLAMGNINIAPGEFISFSRYSVDYYSFDLEVRKMSAEAAEMIRKSLDVKIFIEGS